jgi:NADPH-dependent 2,4-dienoyl-CoA reductase/sulfur reductase-like enzyme
MSSAMLVHKHVVIVGGGLAGWRTAEELRTAGFDGRLTVLTDENYPPYDRPPLSKRLLKPDIDPVPDLLASEGDHQSLGVDLRCGAAATALRPGAVVTDQGAQVAYDALVIATGVRARTLPLLSGHPRAYLLRTFDDAMALRTAMDSARSVLVVGAGFVGAEVATAAHDRGLDVTVVEVLGVPYERSLGTVVGGILGRMATRYGVRLLTGRGVRSVDNDTEAVTVTLTDGSRRSADIAVVGVGSRVDTEWLAEARPQGWTTGITCDGAGRVRGLASAFGQVYALGDVACWHDEREGRGTRFEHWTTAVEQAAIVASTLLRDLAGEPREPIRSLLPYFWSDQYGRRVQLLGHPGRADRVRLLNGAEQADPQAPAPRKLLAGYYAGDSLVAVAGVSAPALVAQYRPLLETDASRENRQRLSEHHDVAAG